MRVLLIGGSGQVGRALQRELSDTVDLVALARTDLELTDHAAVRNRLRDLRPDLVINAAAWTAVDAAELDPAGCAEINAIAPGIIAVEAERLGAAMIHYSTDYVFDGTRKRRWREDDRPRPINAYGTAKLAGELAVIAACRAHLILRISWVYDERGPNFLRTMLRLMGEGKTLKVVADQIGAPTSAAVVARSTAAIIGRARPSPRDFFATHGGIVHCACRGATSWHGFAEAILAEARQRGFPVLTRSVEAITTEDYPLPARRPANSLLALSRLRRVHGIETPHWRAALKMVFDRLPRSGATG